LFFVLVVSYSARVPGAGGVGGPAPPNPPPRTELGPETSDTLVLKG